MVVGNALATNLSVSLFNIKQALLKLSHTRLSKIIATVIIVVGCGLRFFSLRCVGLKFILKGRRVAPIKLGDRIIKKILRDYKNKPEKLYRELYPNTPKLKKNYLGVRSLILKTPTIKNKNVIEKGALILKFSETFPPIFFSLNIDSLMKYFNLILEPSSSGYSAEELLLWTTIKNQKIFVLTPDGSDFDFLTRLQSNLVPTRLGAADWVNPNVFYSKGETDKKYDSIYIANFNPVKRVDRYIKAIKNIKKVNPNYKAALVCAGMGSARKEILKILDSNKSLNIKFIENLPQSKLNDILNEAKVNILLSLKEGANKVLSEGLFSGTPAILLNENVGVNRLNINSTTGKIVPDSELEDTLIWFSENYQKFNTNEWTNNSMRPEVSTNTLTKLLRKYEESEGRLWSKDLFVKTNQPELTYFLEKNNWLLCKRKEIFQVFRNGSDQSSIEKFIDTLQNNCG